MLPSLSSLLRKYDVPGPRYTSYPTVPAWTTDVTAAAYQSCLQGLDGGAPLSLYCHIPFCERLCHFCACHKIITSDHSQSIDYVGFIIGELENVAKLLPENARTVTQIHFGGGTPNFLQPEELSRIMSVIRRIFRVDPDAELAIEMHPRTSTHEFCDMLSDLDFNRISLGVQDFDPHVQELIHRFQSYAMTESMLSYLRKLGLHSFNFDLIYGLPGQSKKTWQQTLNKVLELRPSRLAVYSYAHVPWKAPVQRSFQDSDLPPPEQKLARFEQAYEMLTTNGYRLIGMDHFALEDDELCHAADNGTLHRNFMGYTTRANTHQIGLGMSAISYVGGNYFQNCKDLTNYYETLQRGELATFRGHLLDRDDQIRRDFIMAIMCKGRVDYATFSEQWDIDVKDYFSDALPQLARLKQDGIIESNAQGFQVVGLGHLFLRNIAMVFDRYLTTIKAQSTQPTFSQTI